MRNALLAGMVVLGLATPPLLASSPDEMFVLDVAVCWLKSTVPERVPSPASVSGVRGAGVIELRNSAIEMSIDRPGGDYKNVTLPSDVDAKDKATHDRFAKLSGAAFDRAYIQHMVAGHRKAVAAFKKESTSGKDPDVKAWATKTLPTIEDHLKTAQDIAKNVGVVGTSGTKRKK